MAKKFGIVKYLDEDDALGIIPLIWVSLDETYCRFPTLQSDKMREKLIQTEAEPAEHWMLCRISIYGKELIFL